MKNICFHLPGSQEQERKNFNNNRIYNAKMGTIYPRIANK